MKNEVSKQEKLAPREGKTLMTSGFKGIDWIAQSCFRKHPSG
jgi:hypothetical protein